MMNTHFRKKVQLSHSEIQEYGVYLGLMLPQDNKYLPIVEEALKARLPKNWEACEGPNQELLYRNTETKEMQFEHPLDKVYRDRISRLKRETENSMESIDEASYLKESSGLIESKIKKSNFKGESSLQRNTTQESHYSQSERSLYSQDIPAKTFLSRHQQQLQILKNRILQFVPTKEIVHSPWLQKVSRLKMEVAEKQAELIRLRLERAAKEQIAAQVRSI